jgi:ArsR family transcriptional regulator
MTTSDPVWNGHSLDIEMLQQAAEILKTVGHPVRLRIIEALESSELTVKDIQERIGQPQAITSQQLSLMKGRGLVRSRRDGTNVYYALANDLVLHVIECIRRCQLERTQGR